MSLPEHSRRYSLRDVPTYPGTLRGYRQWSFRLYQAPPLLLYTSRVTYDGLRDFPMEHNGRRFDAMRHMQDKQQVLAWRVGLNQALCYHQDLPIIVEYQRTDVWGTSVLRELVGFAVSSEGNPKHEAPDPSCACGLYGLHKEARLNTSDGLMGYGGQAVFGSIKASGRMLIGEHGFRAQFAEVEALSPSPACISSAEKRAGIRQIAEAYGVPYFKSMIELLEAFPPPTIDLEAIPGGISTSE